MPDARHLRAETDDGNPPRRPIHARLSRSRRTADTPCGDPDRDRRGATLPAAHAEERQGPLSPDDKLRPAWLVFRHRRLPLSANASGDGKTLAADPEDGDA